MFLLLDCVLFRLKYVNKNGKKKLSNCPMYAIVLGDIPPMLCACYVRLLD